MKKTVQKVSVDMTSVLKEQLSDLDKKEKRIRKAYMDGIDSLEEYKESRQLIARQRDELTVKLQASANPSTAITEQDKLQMAHNIQNVLEILQSDEADMIKKADAIRSICEKITYDKAAEKLDFYFIL